MSTMIGRLLKGVTLPPGRLSRNGSAWKAASLDYSRRLISRNADRMNGEIRERRRGRPRDAAKRKALVDAARHLYLRLGVDAVTVDQVVATAGVSRSTYYTNFAGQQDLLAAVFRQESERIVSDEAAQVYEAGDLRTALTSYGDTMMRFLADPDTMRFETLIQHARGTRPALAKLMFDAGPRRAWAILARIVAAGQARSELRPAPLDQAVNDLIGLWVGSWRTELMYGEREQPDEAELRRYSRHAVDVFLRAYAIGPWNGLPD